MKLICYLAYGYPSIEESMEIAKQYVEAGCDVLEVSLPTSNPYLDSEYIGERMIKALERSLDYNKYLEGILQIQGQNPRAEIILLAYEDTLLEIGVDKFVEFCNQNNLKSLILVGEKDGTIKEELIGQEIEISSYVRFHLPKEEVQGALDSNGFVYLQATPTGNNINPDFPTLKHCIQYLKDQGITREIYCGVGIHGPEDIRRAKEAGADGVFVGSTILRLQTEPDKLKRKIAEFKGICLE